MREQRWPWLLTAGLMLVAAAATGRSTYLYWLPCRGSMLKGSVINYYVEVGRKFSPACKQAMDGDIEHDPDRDHDPTRAAEGCRR